MSAQMKISGGLNIGSHHLMTTYVPLTGTEVEETAVQQKVISPQPTPKKK